MAARYKTTFKFFDKEEQAQAFCDSINKNNYIRKRHPAYCAPWSSQDGTEHKFVVWYVTR